MKSVTWPLAIILLLAVSLPLAAQTKRTTPARPKKAAPAPAETTPMPAPAVAQPKPSPVKASTGPIPIVTVNGQTLTTADFDPALRQEVEGVDDKIANARKEILDLQINTILLQVEAQRRRITSHRLYELEVVRRIQPPTPVQIKKFMDDNRDQFAGVDPATANPQVEAFLRADAESKLADDLVARLRKSIPVVMVADVNSPTLTPTTIVATVGGQPLTGLLLNERLKPIIFKIRISAYELEKKQADQTIDDILLLAEANRHNITPEQIIRTEISDKVKAPTDAEVTKFYTENKARINGDLNTVRNQVANYLQGEDRERLEKDLSARLRKNADIRWLITEPAQPVQAISTDDDPSLGPADARVTIVEFTDFQCPACAAMHPVLDEVVKSYSNKVRLVVRDYPLAMHANARRAAEAANAANAQGKFFEYTDLLFKRQNALDAASLKKYASELGLNRVKFDAALDSGAFAEEIKHDMDDAEIYGVGSTPTIFVNGIQLRELSAEALRESIDRALAQKAPATPTP